MSPTEGVIGEAWGHYKAHWRHLLPIALVVYVAIAILGALLTLVLGWFGALIAAFISLVGLFWVQGALVRRSRTSATAAPTCRSARRSTASGLSSDRSSWRVSSPVWASSSGSCSSSFPASS